MALAGGSALGEAGNLPGGGGKVGVSPAAPPALAEDIGFPIGHILDNFAGFRVPHQGAPGDLDCQIHPVLAGLARALPVHAVRGGILPLVAEVQQGGKVVVHLQNDGTALAAVPAVRSARRHIFFTVEGNHSVSAVARPHGDAGLIDKRRRHKLPRFLVGWSAPRVRRVPEVGSGSAILPSVSSSKKRASNVCVRGPSMVFGYCAS
ncbi:hypothetical protein SDC9_148196 [bioreactor metagenome]|uniref:Uncharacterized protein n=1 Tax=bioreactor metagenome TaxID=1076179 RepID=A0A645EG65_9ZZZZ